MVITISAALTQDTARTHNCQLGAEHFVICYEQGAFFPRAVKCSTIITAQHRSHSTVIVTVQSTLCALAEPRRDWIALLQRIERCRMNISGNRYPKVFVVWIKMIYLQILGEVTTLRADICTSVPKIVFPEPAL